MQKSVGVHKGGRLNIGEIRFSVSITQEDINIIVSIVDF